MDKKRLNTLLLTVFIFSVFMLWNSWELKHRPKPVPAAAQTEQGSATVTAGASAPSGASGDASVPARSAGSSAAVPTAAGAAAPAVSVPKATVQTDLYKAEISAEGGSLVYLELLKHRATSDNSKNFLLFQPGGEHTYMAQSGLLGEEKDGLPTHRTQFSFGKTTEYALKEGEDKVEVRMTATAANGAKVAKIYTFTRGSYLIDVSYEITNPTANPIKPEAYFQIVRDGKEPESKTFGAFGVSTFTGPAVYTDTEHFQKVSFSEIEKAYGKNELDKLSYARRANNGWVAMVQHYFFSAWLPQGNVERSYYVNRLGDNQYSVGERHQLGTIAPDATVKISEPLYAGPEEHDKLITIAPGLDLVVDYGKYLTVIAAPLFWAMKILHNWIGNWGWTIIVLTILIKLVFFPLSAASYRSMGKMRLVTPKMQKIKEMYKDDRQRQNQEMMELYKREKINPLGGCLPVVVQIPVFLALYQVLLGTVELRDAPWLGWITDLSVRDPYFILPLIMGATMFFQSRLNPTPPDPVQAKVMMYMPVMFTFMFLWFPAGLVLYWTVNNFLSIAQQWQITRSMEKNPPPKE